MAVRWRKAVFYRHNSSNNHAFDVFQEITALKKMVAK
jgi:hypothetical protein